MAEMSLPLNKFEKEKRVIQLHIEEKTIRAIVPIVLMSIRDISKIIKAYEKKMRLQSNQKENNPDSQIKKPSISSLAFKQFRDGTKLTDVVIDLQIPAKKAVKLWSQFLRLEGMYECYEFYQDHSYDIPRLLSINTFMKRHNIYGNNVVNVLRTASDILHLNQTYSKLKVEIEKLEQIKKDYSFQILPPMQPLPRYPSSWNGYYYYY